MARQIEPTAVFATDPANCNSWRRKLAILARKTAAARAAGACRRTIWAARGRVGHREAEELRQLVATTRFTFGPLVSLQEQFLGLIALLADEFVKGHRVLIHHSGRRRISLAMIN